MIQRNESAEYDAGARDALYQYAVHQNGILKVGCLIKTYSEALQEINRMDDESPHGSKARLEGKS